jgi:hypothetical protein
MPITSHRFAVHRTGAVTNATLQGRDYKVFPAVLVQEQVLNNNLGATFLPAEEIEASADAWNAIPVVEKHPTMRGRAISARDPRILNDRGVGMLFNARAEGGKLRADVYVEIARLEALPDTAAYIANAEAGESGELSTGFGASLEAVKGVHNGKPYDYVMRGIIPDHLALLPGEVGACSVGDGCGLGANALATNCGGSCGCGGAKPIADPVANMSDSERHEMLSTALRAANPSVDLWINDVFSEESEVVYNVMEKTGAHTLFRAPYTIAEDGGVTFGEATTVRRVTVYEPTANAAGNHTHEGTGMKNRNEMIAHLVANGVPAATAEALSDAQLAALNPTPVAANAEGEGDGWEQARHWRRKYDELDALTANARKSEKEERTKMIDDLLFHNARHDFPEAVIKSADTPTLKMMHNTVMKNVVANYSGRGGPNASDHGGDFSFVKPILGGARGESALDQKVS